MYTAVIITIVVVVLIIVFGFFILVNYKKANYKKANYKKANYNKANYKNTFTYIIPNHSLINFFYENRIYKGLYQTYNIRYDHVQNIMFVNDLPTKNIDIFSGGYIRFSGIDNTNDIHFQISSTKNSLYDALEIIQYLMKIWHYILIHL